MKGRAEVIEQVPKQYREIVRQARKRGWTIERGRLKHVKLVSPRGTKKIPIPSGNKGGRGNLHKEITAQIRRTEEAEGVHIQ